MEKSKIIKRGFQPKGRFIATLRDLDGNIVSQVEKENLVVNVGKNGFAKLMNGESGFTGNLITAYLAVGTGANAPAPGDTTLQTELARTTIVVGSNSRNNAEVQMDFYFSPTEANGDIKEVGVFVDGTAAANSGTLFDRTLLDVTKLATNSLTITFIVDVL